MRNVKNPNKPLPMYLTETVIHKSNHNWTKKSKNRKVRWKTQRKEQTKGKKSWSFSPAVFLPAVLQALSGLVMRLSHSRFPRALSHHAAPLVAPSLQAGYADLLHRSPKPPQHPPNTLPSRLGRARSFATLMLIPPQCCWWHPTWAWQREAALEAIQSRWWIGRSCRKPDVPQRDAREGHEGNADRKLCWGGMTFSFPTTSVRQRNAPRSQIEGLSSSQWRLPLSKKGNALTSKNKYPG